MRHRKGSLAVAAAIAFSASTSRSLADGQVDWMRYLQKGGKIVADSLSNVQDIMVATDAARYANSVVRYGIAGVQIEPLIPRELLNYGKGAAFGTGVILDVVEADQRRREDHLSWGVAARNQVLKSLSSFTVISGSSFFMQSAVLPCVVSGACAAPPVALGVATAGAAVWAGTTTGKAVQSALDWEREYEQLLASRQQVDELRARLAEQKIQQLKALRNSPAWQTWRSAQLTQQGQPQGQRAAGPSVGPPIRTPSISPPSRSTTSQALPRSPAQSPYIYTRTIGTSTPVAIAKAVPVGTAVPVGIPVPGGTMGCEPFAPPGTCIPQTPRGIPADGAPAPSGKAVVGGAPAPVVAPPPVVAPAPVGAPASVATPIQVGAPVTVGTPAAPGGISLSRAAAMRMALGIDLEGMAFIKGQLVLAGRANDRKIVDAALLLSALRAACEQGDLFFSLDADDGKAWIEDGERAARELWDQISNGLSSQRSGPAIQAFSARRDYAQLWVAISQKYPNLESRLVFHPEWLRQTRFGEILYIADVLLKELAGGVPALPASRGLRAATIDGYVSADRRRLMRSLQERSFDSRSLRLWFDFLSQTEEVSGGKSTVPFGQRQLPSDGDILDLSRIHPKMFVRIHDLQTRQDLPGHDPDLDALSDDVNARTEVYADAYDELRALTDVFRVYVVAIRVVQQQPRLCKSINLDVLPLLPSEKPANALPEYHPSELFLTVAMRPPGNEYSLTEVSSINGGISVRGKWFVEQELSSGTQTALTQEIKRELSPGLRGRTWKGDSGRQFIALAVDAFDQSALALTVPSKSSTIEEVSLASDYGPPIDWATAETALPYALMSRDAYSEEGTNADISNRRVADWKTVFAQAGYSEGQIELIRAAGFSAAIYVNERTGAITIVYRGATSSDDLDSTPTRLATTDIQYMAAADLAWIVKSGLPRNSITLTGHGMGGQLAVFAAEQSGVAQVITFNATAPLFTRNLSPAWINVGWVDRQP